MLLLPVGILVLLAILVSTSISLSIIRSTKTSVFALSNVPNKQAIMVLGAKCIRRRTLGVFCVTGWKPDSRYIRRKRRPKLLSPAITAAKHTTK